MECYLEKKPALSIPCFGERRYGQVAEDELILAVPPHMLAQAMVGVRSLGANGLRHPFPSYGSEADPLPGLFRSCPNMGEQKEKVTTRTIGFDEQTAQGVMLRMTWPVLLERFSMTALTLVSYYLVGQFIEPASAGMAAVGVASIVLWIPQASAFGLGVGSTAVIARDYGSGNFGSVRRVTRVAFLVGLVWGLALLFVAWPLVPIVVELMGLQAGSVGFEYGNTYLHAALLGLPFQMANFALMGSLRGVGDTRTPMLSVLWGNVANAVIAFFFISGVFGLPRLGILASGIGFAGASLVGLLFTGPVASRKQELWKREVGEPLFQLTDLRRLLKMSVPVALEEFQFSVVFVFYSGIIGRLGQSSIAAHSLALRCMDLAMMPGFALGTTTTAMVGQALGAGLPTLALRVAKIARRWAVIVMVTFGVVNFVIAPWIVGLFIQDQEVINIGATLVRVFIVAYPMMAFHATLSGALRASGDVRFVLAVITSTAWGVRLPLAAFFALVLGWGAPGAWLGAVAEQNVRGAVIWWRFRQGHWQQRKV